MARGANLPGSVVLPLVLMTAGSVAMARVPGLTTSSTAEVAEAGATAGFFATPGDEFISIVIGNEPTEIQRLNLPPGSYVVNASAVLATYSDIPLRVSCGLNVGGVRRGAPATGLLGGTGVDVMTSLPIALGVRLDAREDVGLTCAAGEPGLVWSQPSSITAIKVDRLKIVHGIGFDPT